MPMDQSNRAAKIATPLGTDVVALDGFTFNEELSADFDGVVDMISDDFEIDPMAMVGGNVTVELETTLGTVGKRFFNAVVADFLFTGGTETHARYQAVLRPWTWVMSRGSNCRIFQEMTAPQIIAKVIKTAGFSDMYDPSGVTGDYRTREYCVQYNESDANFIYRLMEEEGISSFFVHTSGKHTLTALDHNGDFAAMENYAQIDYFPEGPQRRAAGEIIHGWSLRSALVPGSHVTDDYDFKAPTNDLAASSSSPVGHDHDGAEVYAWPGGYTDAGHGVRYADIRREAGQAGRAVVSGRASARGLSAGHTFKLALFPRKSQNGTYLVLRASHIYRASEYRSAPGAVPASYECRFACSDPGLLYRPRVRSERPRIQGPQTAVVVGPDGEEIHTDEHGRIKVRFRWDRHGPSGERGTAELPENSSCWIRVAQPWAGGGWGGQHIPRMGQEVLVEFLDGNPDHPICTGAVYNGDNTPPFSLPENKTQSGVRSKSTKDATGANQILFEDMAGSENLFVHAQKDYTERVLNTRTTRVDSHDVRSIGDNEYLTVENASHKHVGNTSINIIGGTGPGVMAAVGGAGFLYAEAASSITKAVALPGMGKLKATGIAASQIVLGWAATTVLNRYAEHTGADWNALVAGEDPISDAGRSLITSGQALGEGTGAAPIGLGLNVDIIGAADIRAVGGAKLEAVGAFKIDYVGINHVESIGFNHDIKIGKTQTVKIGERQEVEIGKIQTVDIGEDQTIKVGKDREIHVGDEEFKKVESKAQMQVGKEYKVLAGQKFLGESKVWETYADDEIRMSAPGGFIEINKTGITIRGKKVKIEGNRIDFKKKSGGKGTTCLKGMAKTAAPFVK